MTTVGIICEYNPFHLGHKKQIDWIKSRFGGEAAVVCLMSGNFVQRGTPAVFDKSVRARAAILAGADLVLELPVTYALSSAEGFARGGVEILGKFCDFLCFGCETGSEEILMHTASALLSEAFKPLLHAQLDKGLSFPAARAAALEQMGLDAEILRRPNDILAVEYCKAILRQGARTKPLVIHRQGSYHDQIPDAENPSATSLRSRMLNRENWESYVPSPAADIFRNEPLHALSAGERAMLAVLRTMNDEQFEAIPFGSEGLWRKFMHACRKQTTLEDILTATKSKRYTRTRLDRMAMCAFLGITAEDLSAPVPYVRTLAFNDRGRAVLRLASQTGLFLNAGESHDSADYTLECRCGDLYGLFCLDALEAPGRESKRRIHYLSE